jgi:hypothetical protein
VRFALLRYPGVERFVHGPLDIDLLAAAFHTVPTDADSLFHHNLIEFLYELVLVDETLFSLRRLLILRHRLFSPARRARQKMSNIKDRV